MKNSSILLIALLAATALSSATPALAACPGNVTSAETGGCIFATNGDSVTVAPGGSITHNAGRAIAVNNDVAAGSINNSGIINGSTTGIYQLGANGSITSITNNAGAQIISGGLGIDIDGGRVTNGIINNGTITADNTSGDAIKFFKSDIQANGIMLGATSVLSGNNGINIVATNTGVDSSTITGDITNAGQINARSNGILIDSATVTEDINNNSGASIIAANQHGIWLTNNSYNPTRASVDDIINRGLIRTNGALGDAILIEGSQVRGRIDNQNSIISGHQGIRVDVANGQNSSVAEGILNDGTIQSANEAIYIGNSSTITTNITNNGTINSGTSGIVVSRSNVTGDVVNNASGRITASGFGIRFSNDNNPTRPSVTSVNNAGNITTTAGGVGISLDTTDVGGSVLNSGTINADGDGINIVDGTIVTNNVTNSNTITSANGHGLYIAGATVTGTIQNGNGANITASNGSAFLINNAATGSITNSGTLRGLYAVNITDNTNDRTFTNTGTLDGAIKIERTTLNLNDGTVALGTIGGANGILNINTNLATSSAYGVNDGALAQINVANGRNFTIQGGTNKAFHATTFNNEGTLRIVGNPAANVVATITGNYAQAATGMLYVDAQLPTVRSALSVTGTANFTDNTGIYLNITGNEFDFSGGAVVQDVVSAGTLVANANTFIVTDSSYLYDFKAVIDGSTVDLQSVRDATKSVTGSVNSTSPNSPNKGAAQAVESIISHNPGGEMNSVVNAFGSLRTAQEINDAVSQTMPTLTGGSTTAVLQTMGATGQVIQARNTQNSGLSSGDNTIGDDNVWIKPFGTWSNQGQDDGVVGYDADTYGVIGGIDGDVSDDVRLGVALSYANTNVKSDDARNKLDVDSFQASTYGSYAINPNTEANFQVGAGYNQTDSKRVLNFGGLNRVAEGDIDGYSVQAGAGIAHSIDIGPGTTFTPSARVDYNLMHNGSYTETDAGGLNLKVRSQTTDQLIPAVSGKIDYEYVEDLSLSLNAGVGYDVLNERNSVTASFVGGGPAFVTKGIEASPWVVRTGIGLTYNAADDLDLTVRYDREDRGEFDAQTASIRLRKSF